MTAKKMIVETTTGDTTILTSEIVAMTKTDRYEIVDIHMKSGTIFSARMSRAVEAWLWED